MLLGLIAGIDSGCGPASPLGALQPDLYHRPEGPIYLTASDQNVALGKLHLRVNYDSHVSDLAVHLIEGIHFVSRFVIYNLNNLEIIFHTI